MRYVLFNIEGHRTSGVGTFCRRLGESEVDCFAVSLNMKSRQSSFAREIVIGEDSSHDPSGIAALVLDFLSDQKMGDDEWVLCPNVDDVCYQAAFELRRMMANAGVQSVAILGICHSDDSNQYRVLKHYDEVLDGVLGVSQWISRKLAKLLPRCEGGVDTLEYPIPSSLPQKKPSPAASPLKLVYSGRLECLQKRVGRLPVVVEKLLQEGCSFSLQILGDGSERNCLEAKFRKLEQGYGWSDWAFAGAIGLEEVLGKLAESDIALLVSEYEGTPVSILEALAMGVVPVVMEVESMMEGIICENAIVVSQGDAEAMAKQVVALDLDRARLESLAEHGKRSLMARHSTAACVSQLKRAGQRALAESRKRESGERSLIGYHDGNLSLLVDQVEGLDSSQEIGVFGAGQFGRRLVVLLKERGRTPLIWVDSDDQKWGTCIEGILIQSPEELTGAGCDSIVIGSESFGGEIGKKVVGIYDLKGLKHPNVICI